MEVALNRGLLPHAIVCWDDLTLQTPGLSCASMRYILNNGIDLHRHKQQC